MIASFKLFRTEEFRQRLSRQIFYDKYSFHYLESEDSAIYAKKFGEMSEVALDFYKDEWNGLIPESYIINQKENIELYINDGLSFQEMVECLFAQISTDIVEEYFEEFIEDKELLDNLYKLQAILCVRKDSKENPANEN